MKTAKEKYCLITNDVETTSILNHRLSDKTGEVVLKQGMPRLLELYERYGIKATFFFTGHIAKLYPEVVKMVIPGGHEIGSHGYSHEVSQAFDVLSLDEQIDHLQRSKDILEEISGQEVISFRAPAARVDQNTVAALLKTGYRIDSSIASQRMDMFMSFGAMKKMNWLNAPRMPYFTQPDNIFKRGDSELFEIPISAFGFPYIGTFMRISPGINRMTRYLLHNETKWNNRPINFLTHPNEFIDEERDSDTIQKRGKNYVSYLLGDVLRHKLKVKNLGEKAIPIFARELEFFRRNGYSCVSLRSYYEQAARKKVESEIVMDNNN